MDAVQELQKDIKEILQAIGRMETEVRHLSNMSNKLDETGRLVVQLEASVKSAHKRIDSLCLKLDDFEKKLEEDRKQLAEKEKERKEDRKWLWGFIVGAAALVWKLLEAFKAEDTSL